MYSQSILKRRVIIRDIIVSFVIITIPFVFFLYRFVPTVQIWETKLFIMESRFYTDVQTYFWAIAIKLLTLSAFILWFLTCKHWWKFSILIPIIIELYKLGSVINDNLEVIDSVEFITALPFILPIIFFLIYLSKKLNYYSFSQIIDENIENEIKLTLNEIYRLRYLNIKSKRVKYENLKKSKLKMKKNEYLNKLLALKNELLTDADN